jgi:hypothetical protein
MQWRLSAPPVGVDAFYEANWPAFTISVKTTDCSVNCLFQRLPLAALTATADASA